MSISPIPIRTDFLEKDKEGKITGKVTWPWIKWLMEQRGTPPPFDPNSIIALTIQEPEPIDVAEEAAFRAILSVQSEPSLREEDVQDIAARTTLMLMDVPSPITGQSADGGDIDLTGQVGDIAANTIFTPVVDDVYEVTVYVVCSNSGAGTVDVGLTWTDDSGAQAINPVGTLDLGTLSNFVSYNQVIHALAGNNIQYSTTTVGIVAAAYDIHIRVRRTPPI